MYDFATKVMNVRIASGCSGGRKMNGGRMLGLWVSVVWWILLLSQAMTELSYQPTIMDSEKKSTEHCQLDTFRAECGESQVVLILSARYGRMQVGRCVKRDWGYIGCAADVLAHVDRVCSGRRVCEFPVADLDGNQPCPRDLAPYLETSYQCTEVVMATTTKCNVHEPITIHKPSGYLASVVTMDTGRGGPDCPWRIQSLPGQQVNVTLLNFARIGLPSEWGTSTAPRPKICYQLAGVRERQYSRTLTECEGSARESHAYTSTSNVIEVDVIVAKILKVYFMLHFEAIGCANPSLQPGMWLRREGDNALVKCNSTGASWPLHCVGSTWEGQLENCTQSTASASSIEGWNVAQLFVNDAFPYSILVVVSVGVALGVFVGGVLLVCAARYFKRRHDHVTTDDDYGGPSGPYPPDATTAKTLVLSCDVISPTAHDPTASRLASDLTQISQHPTQKRMKLNSGPTAAQSGTIECHCPYAVYDSFPCSPHGCQAPSVGSAPSAGGGGGGGGGGGARRIHLQRGTHIYECPPQPEILGCLS